MKVLTKEKIHEHIFDEYDHQNLESDKEYEVIGITHEHYRIVNKRGEPVLYPKYLFTVIDPSIPENWVCERYAPDEYYIDPPELSKTGFYEDYFDGKAYAIIIFNHFLEMRTVGEFSHNSSLWFVTI
ncbi:MAG: hypothetical protein GY749_07510 [Desulfobacteraceae bacterium]|nr:hypothetical protein [Desulfobacteraceae bacterium]